MPSCAFVCACVCRILQQCRSSIIAHFCHSRLPLLPPSLSAAVTVECVRHYQYSRPALATRRMMRVVRLLRALRGGLRKLWPSSSQHFPAAGRPRLVRPQPDPPLHARHTLVESIEYPNTIRVFLGICNPWSVMRAACVRSECLTRVFSKGICIARDCERVSRVIKYIRFHEICIAISNALFFLTLSC